MRSGAQEGAPHPPWPDFYRRGVKLIAELGSLHGGGGVKAVPCLFFSFEIHYLKDLSFRRDPEGIPVEVAKCPCPYNPGTAKTCRGLGPLAIPASLL